VDKRETDKTTSGLAINSASNGSQTLADQVAKMQTERDDAVSLSARILGTLRENAKRGNITTKTEEGDKRLNKWIAKWYDELDAIRFENTEIGQSDEQSTK